MTVIKALIKFTAVNKFFYLQKQNDDTGIEPTQVTRHESSDGGIRAIVSELDSLDEEAQELYEWTQGLSLEPLSTPRYSDSLMSGH